ncbi:MAG: DUF1934 domain-containing protein [Bacillota bacterium]
MEKQIKLYIVSSQTDIDGNTDKMEFYAEGKLFIKEHSLYICYKETEITGMEGTTTSVRADKDSVTLIRFGSINSRLVFQEGISTSNRYETQYGNFEINILTNKIDIDIMEGRESSIKLKYIMSFAESSRYINELALYFKY